ncbi:MAG: peptidyl-prolyl cis-trans isomerase [Verrucomicrobiales bacterium]|nr:peptidyl-prolyl cis-trans isomerase [Verrucomicrobiales bacterium]
MLTQIRHIQKGTLIVVTVIIVIAFAFLYSDFDFVSKTVGAQDCVVKVYDRCYRQKEAQKLASNYEVAFRLGMYDFATTLFGESRQDNDRTDFIMSLIILRKEAEKMGIEPTAEEIKEAIPKLPVFQQPWMTADLVKNTILGPNGFTEGDLAQLVKDYLSYQKMRELIGTGVVAVPSEVERIYTKANQRFEASLVNFDRKKVLDSIKVTDEEIKEYFDENQGDGKSLMSEPKRGFEYAKFTPKEVAEDATNEAKAKADFDYRNAVNRAYADLADDESDFAGIAKQYEGDKASFSMSYGTYEPFAMQSPPEELAGNEEILSALFSSLLQNDEVTVPLPTAEGGGYYVFHVTSEVEPKPLTLEQATPVIREALLARKSDRAVNDAANAARAKIAEALEAGKSFAEASKSAELEITPLPNFSQQEPPADIDDAGLILSAVESLGPQSVSEVMKRPEDGGYFLVYVDKIEIYKDEEKSSAERSISAALEGELKRRLFSAWFNQRRMESSSERSAVPTT